MLYSASQYTRVLQSLISVGLIVICNASFCQTHFPFTANVSAQRIYISNNRDLPGFSFGAAVQRNISDFSGIELRYRNANLLKRPEEFSPLSAKSVHYVEADFQVFPFNIFPSKNIKKFLGGFHIGVGPSIYFGKFVSESSWEIVRDANGNLIRRGSVLRSEQLSDFGYHVGFGYNYSLSKRVYTGARLDFAHYASSDGYSAYGMVLGLKLN